MKKFISGIIAGAFVKLGWAVLNVLTLGLFDHFYMISHEKELRKNLSNKPEIINFFDDGFDGFMNLYLVVNLVTLGLFGFVRCFTHFVEEIVYAIRVYLWYKRFDKDLKKIDKNLSAESVISWLGLFSE